MTKHAVIIAMMLLVATAQSRAEVVEPPRAGVLPSDKQEMQDKSRLHACECCQKCKAARRSTKSIEEEGAVETNGCQDCCERCDRVITTPEEIPPEIIDKRSPSDIMEKPPQ